MPSLRRGVFLAILLLPAALLADSQRAITHILQQNEAPVGIVFEIITADSEGLSWALPLAHSYIEQLRKQFPALPIAVVTHGQEQFALQNGQSDEQPAVHTQVRSLTDGDIPVYVCGTYAGWRGLSDEDFPDYVNVAAAGPAQINDYVSLGYTRVLIRQRPD
ncbi:MAG: DsrE family protein [Thiohalophilus sp.]|uniref:DsrE family protein n=1 Tax=Thiohalophilus sp. TaxID=3028392 RepID=UPI002870AA93|nr:DsrE family protein [Thiohalophilus sp.]MDR9437522.1 DsrE family protein [Thiohalophilus sp.]